MLFQKLIEQHRIDRFVTDGLWFSFFVTGDQVRADFSHILGDQTKRERLVRVEIFFVTVRDWLEQINARAGFLHRLDIFLEPARRRKGSDLVVGIDVKPAALWDGSVNIANARGVT